ncbi:hypothetical protein KY285_016181 [Solanum tuberosum]|nr:hypothetical protein KY284_016174 [Solanum tuberosum]KAH0689033.1 hypothetical protein KY289_016391 [Solanum tuberosum]KAH0701903.1 hypothetical protein KY285_016181 [Solanum tuberosum]
MKSEKPYRGGLGNKSLAEGLDQSQFFTIFPASNGLAFELSLPTFIEKQEIYLLLLLVTLVPRPYSLIFLTLVGLWLSVAERDSERPHQIGKMRIRYFVDHHLSAFPSVSSGTFCQSGKDFGDLLQGELCRAFAKRMIFASREQHFNGIGNGHICGYQEWAIAYD